jgi:hypothetical protein
MTKDSAKYIKLISYNEKNMAHNPINSYYTADIKKSSYRWLTEDIPTLSTKSYLITYNYTNSRERTYIKQFLKSLYQKLPKLKKESTPKLKTPHPKWREVSEDCESSLPGEWQYYKAVDSLCTQNGFNYNNKNKENCSERDKALGLCSR